jgi:hypothetical protein
MAFIMKEDSMKSKQLIPISLLFIFLLFLCSACSAAAAKSTPIPDFAIVWSDDFEDGDKVGWQEYNPGKNFFVKEGVLTAGPERTGGIGHISQVSSGTWSFDLFFAEGKEPYYEFCLTCDQDYKNGFGFNTLTMGNTLISFLTLEDGRKSLVNAGSPVRSITGWNHFDVTRDELGNSKLYLNGELILEYKDELRISPYWLYFNVQDTGPALDNLIVRNQVIAIYPSE